MTLALVAPVLANGVRAWGTIYLAQSYGIEAAGGFDHIVYGWIFFALVIAAVLALSWRFFDRPSDDPMVDGEAIENSPVLTRLAAFHIAPVTALAGLLLIVGVTKAWALAADRLIAPVPAQLHLPDVPGWHRVDYAPRVWWEPRAQGADHRLLGRYADAEGRAVDVFVAFYAAQREGSEAGAYGEGAVPTDGDWAWSGMGPSVDRARSDVLRTRGNLTRLAITQYRAGDLLTGSEARLKLATIADRLLLRRRATAVLILSAENAPDRPGAQAIAAFRSATGPAAEWMDRTARLR
jgi:EpsI family protein